MDLSLRKKIYQIQILNSVNDIFMLKWLETVNVGNVL